MSAHGSDASQGSHILESAVAYVLGAMGAHLLGFTVPVEVYSGLVSVVAFTGGKELPQLYAKLKTKRSPKGDLIDTAVHLGTLLPCMGTHLLVT